MPKRHVFTMPPPIRSKNDLPTGDRKLDQSIAMFDEMSRRGQGDFFPDDLPAQMVYDTLMTARQAERDAAQADQEQASAMARRRADEKAGRKLLTRLTSLLDGQYPPQNPKRDDFLPRGDGNSTVVERLMAMARGITIHGLRPLPVDWPLPAIQKLCDGLAQNLIQRNAASHDMRGTSTRLLSLRKAVAVIHQRLSSILMGYFGRDSQELIAYDLRPRQAPGRKPGGKSKKKDTKGKKDPKKEKTSPADDEKPPPGNEPGGGGKNPGQK